MLKKWMFKLNRIIIWPLLAVTLLFLITGFSMTHEAYRIIPVDTALKLHPPLCFIFLILFLIHVIINGYFAIERWKRKPVKTAFIIQLERFAGGVLLITVALFMFSGYAMSGKLFLDTDTAVRLHRSLDIFIIAFILHVGINIYFIFKKWVRS